MNPRIIGLSLFLSNLIFSVNFGSPNDVGIAKAFHHLGTHQDKIIFYFKKTPTLTLIEKKENPESELENEEIYLLKDAYVLKEAKTAIEKINKFEHPFYKFKILASKSGLKIKINYDPQFIERIDPLFFDAISLFKSVMFYIRHKDVTKHLNFNKTTIKNSKPIVIIDAGHGGVDFGAVGINNLAEKQVVLDVSLQVKKLLDEKKINAILTRDSDNFVELDERTKFANFSPNNTIFVSIHANQSVNSNANGLETYYADYELLKHKDNSSFIDEFGFEISKKNKKLACIVHEKILKELKKKHPDFNDRKVRKSVSQILIGTQTPSILIELGYLSNIKDNKILSDTNAKKLYAQGIVKGISSYLKST